MKIATWNINSIRVRLTHVLEWLKAHKIDVMALQETKCEDSLFPTEAFSDLGYHAIYKGQKSYNGVALLAKKPLTIHPIQGYCSEHNDKRIIVAEYEDVLIVNVYVPNGQGVGTEKYFFKLEWLKGLADLLMLLKKTYKKIIVLGDFNIAPETIDHTSASFIKDEIMRSDKERERFRQILALGFVDSFRVFNHEPKQYTWWDYRIKAFEKNLGYRIDHILASEALAPNCQSCVIDTVPRALEKPSDHAPVILEIKE